MWEAEVRRKCRQSPFDSRKQTFCFRPEEAAGETPQRWGQSMSASSVPRPGGVNPFDDRRGAMLK
jgi:hypothetical protein